MIKKIILSNAKPASDGWMVKWEREQQKEPFRNLLYLVTNVGSTKERKKEQKKLSNLFTVAAMMIRRNDINKDS